MVNVRKVTPVLVVDRIEPCLSFWEGQLGYARVAEVPHEDALGFVILVREGTEMMLQTKASLAADMPAVAARNPEVVLYAEVASVDDAIASTKGATVILEPRTTFYGAKEIGILDPSGQVLLLAERHG
ncbi:Hypothetical protein A7982_03827 [Minicystis rosea]|nr:Hypothetical protein A7982_03827 [Minicystis rosea]